jgi:polysaccharide biosynthesis protein VpsQ
VRFKILAGIYVFVLAAIVFLANGRETSNLFVFIRALPYGDKIGHFVLMGIFSLLLNLALNARSVNFGRINFLLGSAVVLPIVTIEEFSQIFLQTRSFDWIDLLFDFAGILLFGELARFLIGRQKRGKLAAS